MPYIPRLQDLDSEIENAVNNPQNMYNIFDIREQNDPLINFTANEKCPLDGWDDDF